MNCGQGVISVDITKGTPAHPEVWVCLLLILNCDLTSSVPPCIWYPIIWYRAMTIPGCILRNCSHWPDTNSHVDELSSSHCGETVTIMAVTMIQDGGRRRRWIRAGPDCDTCMPRRHIWFDITSIGFCRSLRRTFTHMWCCLIYCHAPYTFQIAYIIKNNNNKHK